MRPDGERGWPCRASEEDRDSYYGGDSDIGQRGGNLPAVYEGLSEDGAGSFPDSRIRDGRRSMGLTSWQKLFGQLLVTGIFVWYLTRYTDVSLAMRVPWSDGIYLDFGIWNIPILFFIVLGTANGTNFTDGLDGLAGSVTLMVAVFFAVAAIGTVSGIAPLPCAVAGALMGFLLFNVHPAAVFMGDTGSLALGGFVAGCAYILQMPLYIAIVGVIYLVEVCSVILQVGYFKASGGKRILRMAPLHHHFELCGWSETRITAVFTIITALMCLLALGAIK